METQSVIAFQTQTNRIWKMYKIFGRKNGVKQEIDRAETKIEAQEMVIDYLQILGQEWDVWYE